MDARSSGTAPAAATQAQQPAPIPAVVLGGTGYIAGELLRLLATHPRFTVAAILSDSQPGSAVAEAFPHLAPAYPAARFSSPAQVQELLCDGAAPAVFSAAPHGVTAVLIDSLLTAAAGAPVPPRVVDVSADFRFRDPRAYAQVYQHAHGAPHRLEQFTCALPEHLASCPTAHVAHPGCFATAILLASVPLLAAGLVGPELFVSGVTGSTGSGRKPVEGTHHPLRHSDLYSYGALRHRHAPEVAACAAAATGTAAHFHFVAHSGPFARGIHVTVQAALQRPADTQAVLEALARYYDGAPFVRIASRAPHVKDVATSNYAQLSASAAQGSVAVMCAIDNLNKGAAGGAIQWMNRLFGLPETSGLCAPAAGWT